MDRAQTHEEREELRQRIAAWTETPLNLLGVMLLGILVVEFATELSPEWSSRLNSINWFIYAVFTAQFFVQLALAAEKLRYLRQNWLAAVSVLLPAFRVFRVLRALRAVRGLRLVRVLTATNRGTRSLGRMLRGHQFGRVLGLTMAVIAVGAAALSYFEASGTSLGGEYGDAVWWAIGFVTTIGSDFQPDTLEGRVVTFLLVVWGLGVFGYVTGAVASYFVGKDAGDGASREIEGLRREVGELRLMLAQALEARQERSAEE